MNKSVEIYQSNTPTFTSRVRPWTLEQGQRRAAPSTFVEIEVDTLEEGLVGVKIEGRAVFSSRGRNRMERGWRAIPSSWC